MNTKEALAIMEEIQSFLGKYLIKDADFIHAMEYTREHLDEALPEVQEAYHIIMREMRVMFGISLPEAA